jgi:hypothetical protein
MKPILFFLFLFASGYSFCGCMATAYITLNGKIIACNGQLPYGMPIDSAIYLNQLDTIYVDSNENNIISCGCERVFFNDTALSQNTLYISMPGSYGGYTDCEGGAYTASVFIEILFNNTTGTSSVKESPVIKILSNPISSTLKLTTTQTITQLNIYDQLGRLQSISELTNSGNIYETNVENLAKGVYNVEVTTEENTKEYIKIVKQ